MGGIGTQNNTVSLSSDLQRILDGTFQPCSLVFRAVESGSANFTRISPFTPGLVPNFNPIVVPDYHQPDDTPEDPDNPNSPVTIRTSYHYELVFSGFVTNSIQLRSLTPQNAKTPLSRENISSLIDDVYKIFSDHRYGRG